MIITSIEVKNYRNYASQSVTLSEGVNIFMGNNAQGKTNLLEAVYLCSVGKSGRTPRDKELIRWNEDAALVACTVKKAFGCESVQFRLSRHENKQVIVNGIPLSRIGELMGTLNAVFFSPDELRIVKDGPGERRRFMDIAISQLSKNYLYTLTRYMKILSQRNKLLKSGKAAEGTLDIWDGQLVREGARLIRTRRGFVRRLCTAAADAHSYLTSNGETLEIEYESIKGDTQEEIEQNYKSELLRMRQRDIALGYTHAGAHKDDFAAKCNGVDMRSFGSQGQQRTVALSLKLAELDISKEENGESPVLLLDDVLSELDIERRKKLVSRLNGIQTIITCTDIDEILSSTIPNMTTFHIENGKIVR